MYVEWVIIQSFVCHHHHIGSIFQETQVQHCSQRAAEECGQVRTLVFTDVLFFMSWTLELYLKSKIWQHCDCLGVLVLVPRSLKKDAYEVEIQNLLKWVTFRKDTPEYVDDLIMVVFVIVKLCVLPGRRRCWTTLRTRVRTRSCRTLRGKSTSCSLKWRQRRTHLPGLSSPRYTVRTGALVVCSFKRSAN